MSKVQFENFYNEGFGWICKSCEKDLEAEKSEKSFSRLMREGEAESKSPTFSNSALARWADSERKSLVCPRCNLTEICK